MKTIFLGRHITLKWRYVEILLKGKKKTTIRKGIVRPKYREVFIHSGGKVVAKAEIVNVKYKKVRDLSEEDARRDGFSSLQELLKELKKTYGKISSKDWVTIIELKVKSVLYGVSDGDVYLGLSPVDVARLALRYNLELSEREKELLEEVSRSGSIRKASLNLYGRVDNRRALRRVIRKALRMLIEKDIIKVSGSSKDLFYDLARD
ncbi:MAG: ASCH domain-containing protein [Thermoprotei archaeon]|nr:MAG: ASCH domain-containing protein [Thermoprotei archaeon]HDI75637.1 ASCH domain-containing protein [Thermoprotei archaeon]